MATPDVLQDFMFFDHPIKGENGKSRAFSIEKKIEFLENLNGKVSNRRARRWLNDRLLMELVPRLNGEEIRGLFAPPPFGDDVRLSPFCMTNVGEWDKFRNIDMDKEAMVIQAHESSSSRKRSTVDADKIAVLTAWHRINCRTREAFRRSSLPELINGYEFYNLVSVTATETKGTEEMRMTKIKKKKEGSLELPKITLCQFLKMAEDGFW